MLDPRYFIFGLYPADWQDNKAAQDTTEQPDGFGYGDLVDAVHEAVEKDIDVESDIETDTDADTDSEGADGESGDGL